MIVQLCGHDVKCFTDIGNHIVISKLHGAPIVDHADDVLIDNGVYAYLSRGIEPSFYAVVNEYLRFINNIVMTLKPRVIRLIAPDNPFNPIKNIEWARRFAGIPMRIQQLYRKPVVTYIVAHQFDKYLDDYIKTAIECNYQIAFPCRWITTSRGKFHSTKPPKWVIIALKKAINHVIKEGLVVHLLGPSKTLIKALGCSINWGRITFDTLAYRKAQDTMVTGRDPVKLERAFWNWWLRS